MRESAALDTKTIDAYQRWMQSPESRLAVMETVHTEFITVQVFQAGWNAALRQVVAPASASANKRSAPLCETCRCGCSDGCALYNPCVTGCQSYERRTVR